MMGPKDFPFEMFPFFPGTCEFLRVYVLVVCQAYFRNMLNEENPLL